MTTRTLTLPLFGALLPAHGGHFGGVLRGAAADGSEDYVLIVSEASAGEMPKAKWATKYVDVPGTASKTDGLANTQAMADAKLTLAKKIHALDIAGHKDWYLPAASELRALHANVPELFEKTGWYWSSTQHSPYYAWVQHFEYGYSSDLTKVTEYRSRAVRRFAFHGFSA